MTDVHDVSVESSLHAPDLCTIKIADEGFKKLDDEKFKPGDEIVVKMGTNESKSKVFHGEVVGIDVEAEALGHESVVIRCYDHSHRLHRGRATRTFKNSTFSDVVQKVASEAGLPMGTVDSSTFKHEWLIQDNKTNWEFLNEIGDRAGFRLFVGDGKKLHFKKIKPPSSADSTLNYGENLRSFRPRLHMSPCVEKVKVQGWDPKEKRSIVAEVTRGESQPKTGSQEAHQAGPNAFGQAANVAVHDRPIFSQAEAKAIAQSVMDDRSGDYIEAEGLLYGDPNVLAGKVVEIKNAGKKFSGKYEVTTATHSYTPEEGYSTTFQVSGKRSPSVAGALAPIGLEERHTQGYNIVVGIVTANDDPDKLGRVKVRFPWLSDSDESHWARIASHMAGKDRGFYNLPEIDDEVLVAFEHGDLRFPYVIGMLWNGKDKPPKFKGQSGEPVVGGEVNQRGYVTRIGHELSFDDSFDHTNITILTKNGHKLVFDDRNEKITLVSTNKHKIELDDPNVSITLTTAGGNKVVMQDGEGIKMTDPSGNSVEIKTIGSKISLTALASLEITAPQVTINAMGKFSVTAADSEITGATIALTAGMIRLNS